VKPELSLKKEKLFWRLAKIGFSARRKMLKNNLAAGLNIDEKIIAQVLEKTEQKTTCRAQDLSVKDWLALVALMEKIVV
ncbi:MAG TPA: hypothetical protein PKN62_02120, partial [bacterium]|nr:hypothetical protein [bacterium]